MRYVVQLNDAQYNRIWDSESAIDASSVVYSGPTLAPGTYHYYVAAGSPEGACSALASGTFVYMGGN
jgi:hypothetical protein